MQVKAAKMAELLQDTRRRRTSASLKLRVVIGTVTESVEAVNEMGPTEQAVARHKVQLEESWRLYDLAFFTHLDLLEAEAAEVEMAAYQDHLRRYEITLEKIEALVATRRRAEADLRAGNEVRAAADARAAAAQADPNAELLYNIADAQREAVFTRALGMGESVQAYFADVEAEREESRVSLLAKATLLDRAEELLNESNQHTQVMVRHKPLEARVSIASEADRKKEVENLVERSRTIIALKMGKLAPTVTEAPTRTAQPALRHNFKKRDLPTFGGERRDFPAFRR